MADKVKSATINSPKSKLKLPLAVPTIQYEVVATYDHDPTAYTEGLKFYNGFLYESTGRQAQNQSTVRRVELDTGHILEKIPINKAYFAEGLTILGGRLFQLTENSGVGLTYDIKDLSQAPVEFKYKGWVTGWGLTDDGKDLIMSDGTDQLRLINPNRLELVGKSITVSLGGSPLTGLNELEYVKSMIYANVRYSNSVFRIDPKNGEVLAEIDLSALRPPETTLCVDCILNGVAYDQRSDHLFVTGKMWPKLFEIRLVN